MWVEGGVTATRSVTCRVWLYDHLLPVVCCNGWSIRSNEEQRCAPTVSEHAARLAVLDGCRADVVMLQLATLPSVTRRPYSRSCKSRSSSPDSPERLIRFVYHDESCPKTPHHEAYVQVPEYLLYTRSTLVNMRSSFKRVQLLANDMNIEDYQFAWVAPSS